MTYTPIHLLIYQKREHAHLQHPAFSHKVCDCSSKLIILSDAESFDEDLEKVIFETAELESLSNAADGRIQVTNSTTTTTSTTAPQLSDSTQSGPYDTFTKFPIYGEDRFCPKDQRQKLGLEYKTATVFGLYNTGTNLLLQLLQYVSGARYIHLHCHHHRTINKLIVCILNLMSPGKIVTAVPILILLGLLVSIQVNSTVK